MFLSIIPFGLRAGFDFNFNCKAAFKNTFSLRFEDAKIFLEKEKKNNPDNAVPVYIENYIDFLSLVISEDYKQFESKKNQLSGRLEIIKSTDPASPYNRLLQAEILFQWAILRVKFNQYITASIEFKKAYNLLIENASLYPSFEPNLKYLGIMHAMIGTIPQEYKWASTLLGFSGDLKAGMKEIEKYRIYAKSGLDKEYLREEADFIYLFSLLNLGNNEMNKGILLTEIVKTIADNPLLIFLYSSAALRYNQNDLALGILERRITPSGEYPFYYLDYLKGVCKLNKLDFKASSEFMKYLRKFPGNTFVQSAWQKLGWCYYLQGDRKAYNRCLAQVLESPGSISDEDKQAFRESKNKTAPDSILLRARLLFDGGYYQPALDILDKKRDFPNAGIKLEHDYRKARVLHQMKRLSEAKSLYESVMDEGSKREEYFAASAALQLGLLYEEKKDKSKAEFYFKKCLSLSPSEYSASLHQKSKAGLERIR